MPNSLSTVIALQQLVKEYDLHYHSLIHIASSSDILFSEGKIFLAGDSIQITII